jgi:hypothetical protein
MTRDFLIHFDSESDALIAVKILSNIVCSDDGVKIFDQIDNRGSNIFVTLTYPREILDTFEVSVGNKRLLLKDELVFVAIKNGHHEGSGYYLDSKLKPAQLKDNFPLKNIFTLIMEHFNVSKIDALI